MFVQESPQAMEINGVAMAFFPLDEEAGLLLRLLSQSAQTSYGTCPNQEQGDTRGFWHGYYPSPDWHCYQESNNTGNQQSRHGFLPSSIVLLRKHRCLPVSKAILVPGCGGGVYPPIKLAKTAFCRGSLTWLGGEKCKGARQWCARRSVQVCLRRGQLGCFLNCEVCRQSLHGCECLR